MTINRDLISRVLFILCAVALLSLLCWAGTYSVRNRKDAQKTYIENSKRNHKEHMLTLSPMSYRDSSGISSILLAEETIYCFDSVKNKQWVESSNQMIFQRLVTDLRHTQANVSLKKSLDSVFVAEWDNVYYIPRIVN
jgi:hypothetical protein